MSSGVGGGCVLQSGRGPAAPAALSVSSGPSGSSRGAAGGGAAAAAGAGPDVEPAAGSGGRERAGSGCGADDAAAAAAERRVELVVSSAFLQHRESVSTRCTLNSETVFQWRCVWYLAAVLEEAVWGCCWACERCRS